MLSRAHRFHGLGSLNLTYKKGRVVRAPLLSLKFTPNPRRRTYRAAVVVSRKVNKSAVVRNRIRRRVYEALAGYNEQIARPYDLIFTVFSEQVATTDFKQLQNEVGKLLRNAQVLGGHDIVDDEGNRG